MMGQIVSIFIGAVIVYFAAKALLKAFKYAKAGKCAGCNGDCSLCSPESKDN